VVDNRHDGEREGTVVKYRSTSTRRRQGGVIGLADAALGLAVVGIALPVSVAMINQQTQQLQDQSAAQQLKAVTEATTAYLSANASGFWNGGAVGWKDYSGAQQPADTLTIAQLKAAGFLPASFSTADPFGHSYQIIFRRILQTGGTCSGWGDPCKPVFEAVVYAAGNPVLKRNRLGNIAAMAGTGAGVTDTASRLRGTFQTYCEDLTNFNGGAVNGAGCGTADTRQSISNALANVAVAPAANEVGAATYVSAATTTASAFLNRYDTGNIEDNTMHTAIQMNSQDLDAPNNINNANAIGVGMAAPSVAGAVEVNTSIGIGVTPPGTAGSLQANTSIGVGVAPSGTAGTLQANTSIGVGVTPPGTAGSLQANTSIGVGTTPGAAGTVTANTDVILAALKDLSNNPQNVSKGVFNVGVYSPGDSVSQPACPENEQAQIFIIPVGFTGGTGTNSGGTSVDATGYPIAGVRAWAGGGDPSPGSPGSWTINIEVLTEDPTDSSGTGPGVWSTPGSSNGKVIAFTKCS
jgi:hypothetical protein